MTVLTKAARRGHTCLRCGAYWLSRLKHPRCCPNPKCRSLRWDVPKGQEPERWETTETPGED